MLATHRLPGIRIAVTPPPLAEVLPRMDIAVFAGFAATGPAHRPVAIESVVEYATVFGPDAQLAFDRERGERVYACLGASVRAFFSNGGRRCWVIRVARTFEIETLWCKVSGRKVELRELAVANRFALAGILALPGCGTTLSPAEAQARSLGSWSDGLQVQTALAMTGFELACAPVSPPLTACMSFRTSAPLQPGDLIEVEDPAPSSIGPIRRYAIVDKAATLAEAGVMSSQVQVKATLCAAFEPIGVIPDSPPSLTVAGTAEIGGVTAGRVQATFESGPVPGLDTKISFTMARSSGLVPGHWVNWSDGIQVIWLRIDRLDSTPTQAEPGLVDVVAIGQAWREVPVSDLVLPFPAPTRAASLTLDMRVIAGQTEVARLEGVGLTAAHRAAWWRQTSDAVHYTLSEGINESQVKPSPSHTAARFPLAAMDEAAGGDSPLAWIPLGVNALFGEALPPLPQTASPLERDGLSRFDNELFLDPELTTLDAGHLIEQADVIRFLSDTPRELFAVLGLPRHYLAAEAIHHATRLRALKRGPGSADPEGFAFNERRALSYGALYHPWLVSIAPGSRMVHAGVQTAYPPDGIAAGLLAARASLRGAWIAPANEPFREVSALTPVIEPNAWQALQDAQINLVRADSRGFLTLSADTLSDELEWRPINVRRLLILLRRLALLRGASYVFEPNDGVLRRAVERGFTFLLTDLFRRGAFAGATSAESFMVVTSGAINTGADREAGRFFVELRVAPSLPLQFLTIRLTQNGERFSVLEGA